MLELLTHSLEVLVLVLVAPGIRKEVVNICHLRKSPYCIIKIWILNYRSIDIELKLPCNSVLRVNSVPEPYGQLQGENAPAPLLLHPPLLVVVLTPANEDM